ncbi:MAG: phenylalanine--tRNA ligase beta subunit-related protein [Pseudomonadota bacterium]
MKVALSKQVLQKFPNARIAIVTASIKISSSCQYIDDLKSSLPDFLHSLGLEKCNYAEHPSIKSWREIYTKEFNVKPKQYKSSIDALVRRILTGNKMWEISNIVDLYNVCSVLSLLPMGGYDLKKISGDITIRYAEHNEVFEPLGEKQKQPILPNHIVYADAEKLLCWLWNHKDSKLSCLDQDTKEAIFFIDSADTPTHLSLEGV